jgi:polysaccharide export outer membrane protein
MKPLYKRTLTIIWICLLVTLTQSCQSSLPETLPTDATLPNSQGQLSEGDLIQVTFPGAPNLDLTQKVLSNGQVNLPIIGDVAASGKKLGTFQRELEGRYREHLADPRVLVSLETPSAVVYVSGEVTNPGKVPLSRPLTVLEAIMESGGFSRFANRKEIFVVRKEGNLQKRYVRNLNETLAHGNGKTFYLKPYDVIYVKQSAW